MRGAGGGRREITTQQLLQGLQVAEDEDGSLPVLLEKPLENLIPQDRHAHRGFNPQTDLLAPELQDHHPDLVPDGDPFANLASQYQQPFLPIPSQERGKSGPRRPSPNLLRPDSGSAELQAGRIIVPQ